MQDSEDARNQARLTRVRFLPDRLFLSSPCCQTEPKPGVTVILAGGNKGGWREGEREMNLKDKTANILPRRRCLGMEVAWQQRFLSSQKGICFPAVRAYFPCQSLLPRSKSKYRISAPTALVKSCRFPCVTHSSREPGCDCWHVPPSPGRLFPPPCLEPH